MQNKGIIERSKGSLFPQLAIIVYTADRRAPNCEGGYLEMHTIDVNGRMREGVPLSRKCITDIARNFSDTEGRQPHGAMPSNLLWCDSRAGAERYVWYNPPRKRMLYFVPKLGIENGEYHVPGVVYDVHNGSMDIYAYKGQKPSERSELFKGPFFNVTDGDVCLGSSSLKYPDHPTFTQLLEFWENLFWLTEFSHLGGSQNPTKNNLVMVTKNSVDRFDEKELLSMNMKLNNLLK